MCVGVFNHTLLRGARAILVFVHLCSGNTFPSFSMFRVMSRYTRDSGRSYTTSYSNRWTPPTEKDPSTKGDYSGWCKRDTRSSPSEYASKHHYWDESRAQESANDTAGATAEGKDSTRGNERSTEDGVAGRDSTRTKEREDEGVCAQKGDKAFVFTREGLENCFCCSTVERRASILHTRRERMRKPKVYNLNQKAMQALDALAE